MGGGPPHVVRSHITCVHASVPDTLLFVSADEASYVVSSQCGVPLEGLAPQWEGLYQLPRRRAKDEVVVSLPIGRNLTQRVQLRVSNYTVLGQPHWREGCASGVTGVWELELESEFGCAESDGCPALTIVLGACLFWVDGGWDQHTVWE